MQALDQVKETVRSAMEKEGAILGCDELKRDLERSQEENERLHEDMRREKEQWEVPLPLPFPLVREAVTGGVFAFSHRRERAPEGFACFLRVDPEGSSGEADFAGIFDRFASSKSRQGRRRVTVGGSFDRCAAIGSHCR